MLAKMVPVYAPDLDLPTPVRYRFDVSSPVAVHEDLLVTGDSYQMRQSNQEPADVPRREKLSA